MEAREALNPVGGLIENEEKRVVRGGEGEVDISWLGEEERDGGSVTRAAACLRLKLKRSLERSEEAGLDASSCNRRSRKISRHCVEGGGSGSVILNDCYQIQARS